MNKTLKYLPLSGLLVVATLMASPTRAEFSYISPDLKAQAPVMTVAGEPLSQATNKIIPSGFSLSYGPKVTGAEKIQWPANKPWPEALKKGLGSAGLQYDRKDTNIVITRIPPAPKPKHSWNVQRGQLLSQVLNDWGKVSKTRIQFLTDRDWPIASSFAFSGTFENATTSLLKALSSSDPAPIGELTNNRKLLLILNQGSKK
ncbi:TcpQ domain-containing protein [Kiloniella sp.]|uniref:TcpQ domain-containing protein n=1 Tax=Kiloniella sp. TaxID=1938587 RepID=UPI003B01027B